MLYSKSCLLLLILLLNISSKAMPDSINIALHSDLHVERIPVNSPDNQVTLKSGEADIFVLAGDIDNGLGSLNYARAVSQNNNNKPVVLVAGNHEYYGHDIKNLEIVFRTKSAKNEKVFFLEKESVILNNIRFLGCTLWSDFTLYKYLGIGSSEYYMAQAEKYISDFGAINVGNRRLTATDIADDHRKCVDWLEKELSVEHEEPTIIITHFAPVPECIDEKWKQHSEGLNPLSPYFVNDLGWLIKKWQPDYWFYGHTHSNINLMIGKTKIVSNQKGYLGQKDGEGYRSDWLIKLTNNQ